MRQVSFSLAELKAYSEGNADDNLKGRINEAENLEKFSNLREQINTDVKAAADELIKNDLESLEIPDGIKSIALVYDLNTETKNFVIRSTGFTTVFTSDFSTADDIVKLYNAAVVAREKKDNGPLAFMTKNLGDAHIGHLKAVEVYESKIKPAIDAAYTNTKAALLSAKISEIPDSDTLQVKIQYSGITSADGEQKPGWLAPSVGKAGGRTSTGTTGTRRPKVKPPEPHAKWEDFCANSGDAAAKTVLDAQIKKWGDDWSDHISITNALRAAKHPVFMAEQTRQWTEHKAAGHEAFRRT